MQDMEGAGQWIGARGSVAVRHCNSPEGAKTLLMAGDASGTYFPPAGSNGAPYAPTGNLYMKTAGSDEKEFFPTMCMKPMFPGDILYTECMGGGGYGNPLDRDPEKIRLDVRDEYISVERARNVYGVVINPTSLTDNPEDVAVDTAATDALRKELRDDPKYRHIDDVRDDVRAGKISVEEAKDKYSVVIVENLGYRVIDYKATEHLRPH